MMFNFLHKSNKINIEQNIVFVDMLISVSFVLISPMLNNRLPYLPVYKLIPCISRPPILEPKNKFFLFLCKNFLEKLIFYLIRHAIVARKICPDFLSQFLTHV